jgi:hypothetical protein
VPLQQPSAQELESQTHCPVVLSHSWPDPQAPHVAPPVPHDIVVSDPYSSHVPVGPPTQHPWAHEVASQTHCPIPLHSWPVGHAAHMAPAAPQEAFDSPVGASHLSSAVQQPGHDVPAHEHAPAIQFSPVAHALHAPPPVPHAIAVCADTGTQAPAALQQPIGQDVASHAHVPLAVLHSCPDGHAAQATPPLPH